MRLIANGIGAFAGRDLQFARVGAKLRRDGVGGIFSVDQRFHGWRNRDGVARGDLGEGISAGLTWGVWTHGGVHSTSWIWRAPLASMTRRSNPSATPLAGGMWARAARKSSSIGQDLP